MKKIIVSLFIYAYIAYSNIYGADIPLIFGVNEINIKSNSGYKNIYGIFINQDSILISSNEIESYPLNIKVSSLDDSVSFKICIANANLIFSDENLAILKITNYTDDYCNFSSPKYYHKYLINNQIIDILTNPSPVLKSPKIKLKNYIKYTEEHKDSQLPYFNNNYEFIGIKNGERLIDIKHIETFLQKYEETVNKYL